jgi:hypothetical protein
MGVRLAGDSTTIPGESELSSRAGAERHWLSEPGTRRREGFTCRRAAILAAPDGQLLAPNGRIPITSGGSEWR